MTPNETKGLLLRIARSYPDGKVTAERGPRLSVFWNGEELPDVVAVEPEHDAVWQYLRNPETGAVMMCADGSAPVVERRLLLDLEYRLL